MAAGLALAVAAPVGWWATHRDTGATVGGGTVERLATAGAETSAASVSPTAPASGPASASTPVSTLPPVPTSAGAPGAAPAVAVAVPARVQLAAAGIDAPVDAMGVDADGAMALPEDVARVGWYRFGASPSARSGATVIAGHVDSAVQGEGAMFTLREAEVGDAVLLTLQDGTTLEYTVAAREEFDKHDLPVDAIFDTDGPPRLTLITCGGQFDRAARSYEDNIVVTALPR